MLDELFAGDSSGSDDDEQLPLAGSSSSSGKDGAQEDARRLALRVMLEALRYGETEATEGLMWMFGFDECVPLLDWVINHVGAQHFLPPEDAQMFERLKREGKALQGDALTRAVESIAAVSDRPSEQTEPAAHTRTREATRDMSDDDLDALVQQQKRRLEGLQKRRGALRKQTASSKALHQDASTQSKALKEAEKEAYSKLFSACKEMEGLRGHLKKQAASVQEMYSFFKTPSKRERSSSRENLHPNTTADNPAMFACQLDVTHHQRNDDEFNQHLANLVDNLFPQEAQEAQTPAMLLVRGEGAPCRQRQEAELERLKQGFPRTIMDFERASALRVQQQEQLDSVVSEMRTGQWQHPHVDGLQMEMDDLNEQAAKWERSVAEVWPRVQEMVDKVVAIRAMQVTAGDRKLKLHRLDYAMDNMEKVASYQRRQLAGHLCLQAAMQADARSHEHAAKHMRALGQEVDQAAWSQKERMTRLNTIQAVCERPDVHVAAFQQWQLHVYRLLSLDPNTPTAMACTTGSLILDKADALQDDEAEAGQEDVSARHDRDEALASLQQSMYQLGSALTGDPGRHLPDTLIPHEVLTAMDEVETLARSLQERTGQLRDSLEQKTQATQSNPALVKERNLWKEFFNSPETFTASWHQLRQDISC